jgi:hypothetical protein
MPCGPAGESERLKTERASGVFKILQLLSQINNLAPARPFPEKDFKLINRNFQ